MYPPSITKICDAEFLRVYGIQCDTVVLGPEPRNDVDDNTPERHPGLSRLVLGMCSVVSVELKIIAGLPALMTISGVPILQTIFRVVFKDLEFGKEKHLAVQNSETHLLASQFLQHVRGNRPSSMSEADENRILGRDFDFERSFLGRGFYRAVVYPDLDQHLISQWSDSELTNPPQHLAQYEKIPNMTPVIQYLIQFNGDKLFSLLGDIYSESDLRE